MVKPRQGAICRGVQRTLSIIGLESRQHKFKAANNRNGIRALLCLVRFYDYLMGRR